MSSEDAIIEVDSLSKKFCRSLKPSLRYGVQDLARELVGLSRTSEPRAHEFWALRDVSFKLHPGEVLGLVGPNGSGKTTLLRTLNGRLKPDRGRIHVRGHIGALIALGAGFSPVLTGRENIYINAAVLGIPKREIDARLEEIVEFAEIGPFIDAPVRTYSSGMLVRLGFSVAANLRPDIMLIDEVLAVGDLAFRRKCLDRIREIRESGVAFVFVSHNLANVSRICDRALYLRQGEIAAEGEAGDVIAAYVNDYQGEIQALHAHPGSENFLLARQAEFIDEKGRTVDPLISGQETTLRFEFDAVRVLEEPIFCFMIEPLDRQVIAAYLYQDLSDERISFAPGRHALEVHIRALPLLPGRYQLRMSIEDPRTRALCAKLENVMSFAVVPRRRQFITSNHAGCIELVGEWRAVALGQIREPGEELDPHEATSA